MSENTGTLFCSGLTGEDLKLFEQRRITLPDSLNTSVEIQRGMTITSVEGLEVGKVAAVAVRLDRQQALCLIVSHLPEEEGYQSLPVSWIDRVEGGIIFLNVKFDVVQALPDWHPS